MPRTSAAEAAAREKSSADYLRRRLKEVEATLEAKTARRSSLSKQQHQHHQAFPASRRRHVRRRESRGEENGTDSPGGSASGGAVDGDRGASSRWARPRARKRTGAPGELPGGFDADGQGDKRTAAVMAKLREELASSRTKLAEVAEEASRLRKETRRSEKDCARREPQRQAGKQATGDGVGGGGRRAGRPGKACAVCGERSRSRCVCVCVCVCAY